MSGGKVRGAIGQNANECANIYQQHTVNAARHVYVWRRTKLTLGSSSSLGRASEVSSSSSARTVELGRLVSVMR